MTTQNNINYMKSNSKQNVSLTIQIDLLKKLDTLHMIESKSEFVIKEVQFKSNIDNFYIFKDKLIPLLKEYFYPSKTMTVFAKLSSSKIQPILHRFYVLKECPFGFLQMLKLKTSDSIFINIEFLKKVRNFQLKIIDGPLMLKFQNLDAQYLHTKFTIQFESPSIELASLSHQKYPNLLTKHCSQILISNFSLKNENAIRWIIERFPRICIQLKINQETIVGLICFAKIYKLQTDLQDKITVRIDNL
ncbi:hypothetical protein FGO68_gene1343 [Halteria grandinella]|uniref:Uncharacterized protein n=1 Tax=Halteria grandinella TaxID=5974 RepID=A0A8J8T321_HALGN|nr:hypothetical protein FGO68_gene1343 [Halteria grandinella]